MQPTSDEIITNAIVAAAMGAAAGAGGSAYAEGKDLINNAVHSLGNAYKKGVHPVVKKAAKKTVKKARNFIGKNILSDAAGDFAFGGLNEFGSWYTKASIRKMLGR